MKLRQKIVISTLLLFMAVFTGANILTIENNCKLSLTVSCSRPGMNRRVFPRESNSMCGLKGKKTEGMPGI